MFIVANAIPPLRSKERNATRLVLSKIPFRSFERSRIDYGLRCYKYLTPTGLCLISPDVRQMTTLVRNRLR
jgi:hypothetical protein